MCALNALSLKSIDRYASRAYKANAGENIRSQVEILV